MKGVGPVLIVLLVFVVSLLGYYNFQQQKTIELLNDEIIEQARLRHNLLLKKHVLEQRLEEYELDSIQQVANLAIDQLNSSDSPK